MRLLIHPRAIAASEDLRVRVVESLETALGPVWSRLDRVEVYLTDVNGPRGGPDKRCRVVAHLLSTGRPVVVTRTDRDAVAATMAAAGRCRRTIRSRLKRRRDRRRRAVAAY